MGLIFHQYFPNHYFSLYNRPLGLHPTATTIRLLEDTVSIESPILSSTQCNSVIENFRESLGFVMSCSCFGVFDSCKGKNGVGAGEAQEIGTNNVRVFSYKSLLSASANFHPSNRIGGGGYGVVYRGILRDGTQVAIKSLSAESKQGTREFLTELNMISTIRHPNLVELIGCCVEGSNRILVYQYLENNSLASVLLGSRSKYIPLDWSKRASIILGTASGLVFLHDEAEPHIVHRDIKASNILLDKNFSPKIGDFGLAKLFPDNVTHVSTRVAGTVGYLAPEYALLGQLTKKADVYSFGVLVLEIISGCSSSRAAFGDQFLVLVEWAWKLRVEERLTDLIDPELKTYPQDEVIRYIKTALFCVQAAVQQRPTMKQVVEMLSKDVKLNENALSEPGVYQGHRANQRLLGGRGSSAESSSSQKNKGKALDVPPVTSNPVFSVQSITQMLPR